MKPIPLHLQKSDSLRVLLVILQPGLNGIVVPLAPLYTQLQAFHLLLHSPLGKTEFSFVCVVKLSKLKHSATTVKTNCQSDVTSGANLNLRLLSTGPQAIL